jgi:putative transposase
MSKIRDDQWSKIYKFLRQYPGVYAGKEADCQRFINGVHWIMRTGAQWRELPEKYGSWNSVYKRFARWCNTGVWEKMHHHFAGDPDMENLILDSTVIRAHPCAAGASKKTVDKLNKPWDAVEAASAPKSM